MIYFTSIYWQVTRTFRFIGNLSQNIIIVTFTSIPSHGSYTYFVRKKENKIAKPAKFLLWSPKKYHDIPESSDDWGQSEFPDKMGVTVTKLINFSLTLFFGIFISSGRQFDHILRALLTVQGIPVKLSEFKNVDGFNLKAIRPF